MKKVLGILTTFLILILGATTVFAADKMELNVSKSELNAGDEVSIQVNFDTEESAYAYTAKLNYDENVFERLETDDFEEQDKWSDITFSNLNNKFALINKTGEPTNSIVNIKLKVKEDAKNGNTTITVNSASSSNGEESKNLGTASKEIKINNANAEAEETSPAVTNSVDENIELSSKQQFPWLAVVLVILCVAIGIAAIKVLPMFKLDQKEKMIIRAVAIVLILLLLTISIKSLSTKDVDIDENGSVDYQDSKELMEYILEIKNPSDESETEKLDVNNDGKVDVTDIATTTQEVTKQATKKNKTSGQTTSQNGNGSSNAGKPEGINPPVENNPSTGEEENPGQDEPEIIVPTKASITKAEVKKQYVGKGEEVIITFTVSSNNDKTLTGINIDNTFYPAVNNGDGTYTVSIPAEANGFGEKSYKPTVAVFEGETVILDDTQEAKYYILKDAPVIENYKFNEFVKNQTLEFELKNPDNAKLENATLIIKNENNETVLKQTINVGKTTIELNKLPNGLYFVSLSGKYDLDDDDKVDDNIHDLSEIFETKNIQITSTYSAELKIDNVDIQDEKAIITFTSSNSSNADVEYVVVDGEKYKVEKQEGSNTYTVEIPHNKGEHKVKEITAVIIRNDIDITLTEKQTYEIFKEKPVVKDITTTKNGDNLTVNFNFEDNAKIAKNAKVVVKNGNEVVAEKTITTSDKNIDLGSFKKAGTYTIEFLADFDCADGNIYNQAKINSQEISFEVPIKVEKSTISISPEQAEKGAPITITCEITTNTDEPISIITISGKDYETADLKVVDGKYVIETVAPDKAGTVEYQLEKVKFDSQEIKIENVKANIYVLKQEPKVTDSQLKKSEKTLTFNFENSDNAKVDGQIIVKDLDGNVVYSQKLENGTNTLNLDRPEIDPTKTYQVVLEGTYDLDDISDNGNEKKIENLLSEEFQLEISSEVSFKEFSTRYPEKGGSIDITFKVSSNTQIPVSEIGDYPATPVTDGSDGLYKITYVAQSKSGIENITINKVKHGIENVRVTEVTEQIDVLKTKPSIANYEITQEKNTATIKFKITDEDGVIPAENGAYVTLDGGKYQDKNGQSKVFVKAGENQEITFVNLPEEVSLPIKVYADFDLDTNELNELLGSNENNFKDEELLSDTVVILPPTVLQVEDIQAYNPRTETTGRYLNKSDAFKLTFKAKAFVGSVGGEEIEYYPTHAIIDETEYTLERNGDTYTTVEELEGYSECGRKVITIDSVTLSNNEVIEEDIIGVVEVLKDKLSVENFEVDTSSGKAVVTYDMADIDNSFVSGMLIMTQQGTNKISTLAIRKDLSKYTLDLEEFKKYDIELKIIYDLDENESDVSNRNEEIFGEQHDVEVITDYEIKVSDLQVLSVDKNTHTAKLQFKSTNKSDYTVKYVKVVNSDTDYGVGQVNADTYTFEYNIDKEERTVIKLESVRLENNAELQVEQLSAVIFKNKPEVTKLDVTTENNITIKANFDIKDDDKTLQYIHVALRNAKDGSETDEQTLDISTRSVVFNVTVPGKYYVVVKGTYDAVDGEAHNSEELKVSSKVAEIVPDVKIVNSTYNKYPEKKEEMKIQYEILSNVDMDPTKVTLYDEQDYVLTGSNGKYEITYTAPEVAGPKDIDVTKVWYGDDMYVELNYDAQIDVKKTVPTYTYTSTDLLAQKMVLFKIYVNDPDGAMTSGIANVHNENKELKANETTDLAVQLDDVCTSHNLTIDIEYDLDSNVIPEKENQNVARISDSIPFTLREDYGLKISNMRLVKSGTDEIATYVKKSEPLQLKFQSTNDADLAPEKIFIDDVKNTELPGIPYDIKAVPGEIGSYYVDLVANSNCGVQQFEIESVMLSGGTNIVKDKITFNNENQLKVTVLKDAPTMLQYSTSNNENSVIVNFTIIDEDNALTDSKIILTNTESNEEKSFKIHKGENSHTFTEIAPGVTYSIKIENNYALSEDGKNNSKPNEFFKEDTVLIIKKEEANFKAKNLVVSDPVPDGGNVVVTFENAIMCYDDVTAIVVDGEVINNIQKDSHGVYSVILSPKAKGKNTIHIDAVYIGEKKFDVKRPLTYTYKFITPTVKDVSKDITEKDGFACIDYKLDDPDSSIRTLTAYMKNSSGSTASTIQIENYKANDGTVNTLQMPILKLNTYTIELRATCDIGDGTTEEISLINRGIVSEAQVAVESNRIVGDEYSEKGAKTTIEFKLRTNIDSDVKKIYIDKNGYNVEKVIELDEKTHVVKVVPDTYTVTIDAPANSGIYEQTVTSVQIGNNLIEKVGYSTEKVKVKVLKDEPTFTEFIVKEQDGKATFNLNDADGALLKQQPSKLVVKQADKQVGTYELKNGGSKYEVDLDKLGMKELKQYNIAVTSSYDLRPDAPKEGSVTEEIFNGNVELTGNIKYNLTFKDIKTFYLASMQVCADIAFDCSTGTKYKVAKVVLNGVEYPVEYEDLGNNNYRYSTQYYPKSTRETELHYDRLILENGAALEVNSEDATIPMAVLELEPVFNIISFVEDTKERKVRFVYSLVDVDSKMKTEPLFTLKDSTGNVLQVLKDENKDGLIEFDIPEPPTSVYRLTVTADVWTIIDWYAESRVLYDDEHKSSVTTSILNSRLENQYPKKGETFGIIYEISSTRVVKIDKEDHTNQDKAVGISKLLINDKLYEVETLDERDFGKDTYRIYYTAKNDEGVEDIKVSKILFTNGEEEEFIRTDQIDVLKDVPSITDFKTTNDIDNKKVTFKFKVTDPDNVIIDDDKDIYAEINGKRYDVKMGDNTIVAENLELDKILNFEIKAKYDLDSDTLKVETDQNSYENHTIFKKPFILTGNYGIEFSDIKKFNEKGEETQYFEKGEKIKLTYKAVTTYPEVYAETVTINGKVYTPEHVENTEDTYTVTLDAENTSGLHDITFNAVTLNSGNDITITGQKESYEVLKDAVKVESFNHTIGTDNDKIELDITISDKDFANQKLEIEIVDENDTVIKPSDSNIIVGKNKLNFTRTAAGKYFVAIYSNYDRDTKKNDGKNTYTKDRIHYEIITVDTRYIEMKDILDIELYTYTDGDTVTRVDSISKDNLDVVDNCIVKVTMKDMKEFYSNIKNKEVVGNQLKLQLEYTDAKVFNKEEELKPLEVSLNLLTDGSNEYQYEKSFKSLVDSMRAQPDATFTLTKDYDLSEYAANNDSSSQSIIDFDFHGTINGNGHRIYNAKKPIFNTLTNAKIENLIIDGPIPTFVNNTAVLTKVAKNSTIKNVHIERPLCNWTGGTNGVFAVTLEGSSIENCSVTDLKGNFHYASQQNSSIAVFVKSSTIKNCYISGYMTGGWHYNGGLARTADKNSEISNNIFNVDFTPYFGNGEGGNAALIDNADGCLMKNNICLTERGQAKPIYYRGTPNAESVNNCQLEETTAPKNDETNGVRTIKKSQITADFLKNELGYSEDIWEIPSDASFENLPKLKGISVSYTDEGSKPDNDSVYIPDYKRVQSLPNYNSAKEIVYNNMYKLMPFYDAKELINDGNKIPASNPLSTKMIQYVLPFNKQGKMLSYLTTDNYTTIDHIKIAFKDGTGIQYHVDFDDYYGNVASYMISDLKIGYNYNNYVIDMNSTIVQQLIAEASKYDFDKDLAPLTKDIEEDSRLYKEHFNNVTKNRIPDFVANTLTNLGYNINFQSDLLNKKITQELIGRGNNKLKELLFAYNYVTKWYDLDMQGLNVADALMFQSSYMFDSRLTIELLAKNLISGKNSATNGIVGFYNSYIAPYTRITNLGLYLDHFIKATTTYNDGNDWFKEAFKGGIYETVDIGRGPGVDYTIWDHVKKDGKVQRDILPLLTLPENTSFVVSSPTQVYYGSLRVYMTNPNDPAQVEAFRKNKLNTFLDQIKHFYIFAYDFWGKDTINKYCDTEYDMRTTYTGRGQETVYNNPLTTDEPYHKYFIEAIDRWAGTSGGAYANGNEVFWVVIKMVDNFRVGTHETLHNQDSKIFMNGYGRRGNGEDYAAGFIQQYYRDGWVSPNIFDEDPVKDNTTQNLHRSTVETEDKLAKFYKNYFRVNDFLDYIEAQAFFTLNDADKTKLVTQVYYPQATSQEKGDDIVEYRRVTEDAVANMKLTDMTSLWDNRIMLRPGIVTNKTYSPGADTDSIFNIHWYQPHADDDRPDGGSFKYNAWQMAGEKGYKEGLVAYYSLSYIGIKQGTPSLKTTDSIAIKYITNKDSFKQYKLDRYTELSAYFNKVGKYIDAPDLFKKYKEALQADANNNDRNLSRSTNLKRDTFKAIRAATNDFTIDPFTDMKDVKTVSTFSIVKDTKKDVVKDTKKKATTSSDRKKANENVVANNTVTNTTNSTNTASSSNITNTTSENVTNSTNTKNSVNTTNTVNEVGSKKENNTNSAKK